MNIPPIDEAYRIVRQYACRPTEVDDLVQDLLLEAVVTGKFRRQGRPVAVE